MIVYLYQFEDGTVKQDTERPTKIDLECVADGALTIFRINPSEPKIEECCGHTDTGAFWGPVDQAEVEGTHGVTWHV